jgi:hypothetical protein
MIRTARSVSRCLRRFVKDTVRGLPGICLQDTQAADENGRVRLHYLGPRRHEVFSQLLLRVRACIDPREGRSWE